MYTQNYFGKVLFYFIEVKSEYNIISVAGGSHFYDDDCSLTSIVSPNFLCLPVALASLLPAVTDDMSSLMVLIQEVYLPIPVPL